MWVAERSIRPWPISARFLRERRSPSFSMMARSPRGIAFEGLLKSGEGFAQRLVGAFNDSRGWPQLVHVATDGETYGHHQRFGDMALAYCLQFIESNHLAKITNYGEYLHKFPPTHAVEIFENSSWSCAHGVERWRNHCGCNSGMRPGWNQQWRKPLRDAMDGLRDNLASLYEWQGQNTSRNPGKRGIIILTSS